MVNNTTPIADTTCSHTCTFDSSACRSNIIIGVVGRLGEADEIARCVAFLASDKAGFITGATLSANGGQYMV